MRIRKPIRAAYLVLMGLLLMTLGSVVMLLVSVITLFRARRFCQESIAKWLTGLLLWVSGVRLEIHKSQPLPVTQSIYTANHTTLLDLYILCALGLPNTRYEPPRDFRRLHFLRGWGHGKTKQILTRGQRTSSTDGVRA